ncbi:hypothetical protein BO82DRAFT_353069 [Aspergillus uvarum CBS 121591]|uniref:Uncharacterized protein n=1 Tax=Aspergillus uvarum CBS 121591 TaxID=1448315 RepID=A0A319CGX2_9EURO|nr:hypothetical protein BO82DRAFT_353069 [Aspergillus uvarum CBS 121591]PYH83061.1 hypothetical protein BO82DRAFT_353069 [Aspergillus uvarum CBS 121591]
MDQGSEYRPTIAKRTNNVKLGGEGRPKPPNLRSRSKLYTRPWRRFCVQYSQFGLLLWLGGFLKTSNATNAVAFWDRYLYKRKGEVVDSW